MTFFLIVAVIGLALWISKLSGRVEALENKLKNQQVPNTPPPHVMAAREDAVVQTRWGEVKVARQDLLVPAPSDEELVEQSPSPAPTFTPQPSASVPPPPPPVSSFTPAFSGAAAPDAPTPSWALLDWFKDQTLIKIGAILFFLGAVWFVGYAIAEGWIAPAMQIGLAIIVGLILYAVAFWRERQEVTEQALVLTALGTAVIMGAVYAGQQLYALMPPLVALSIVVASVAYTVVVSVRHKTEALAIAAAVGGLGAPLIIGSTDTSPALFLLYPLSMSAGFLAVVFYTAWRRLTLVLLVGVSYFEFSLFERMADNVLWFFVVVGTVLFFTSVAVSMYRANRPVSSDVAALLLLGFTFSVFASEIALSSALAMFVAALGVAGTGYVYRLRERAPEVQAVMVGVAMTALLLGTTYLWSGYQLAIAFTVEVSAAFLLLSYLGARTWVRAGAALLYVLPVLASLTSFGTDAWGGGVWHLDALTVMLVALALLAALFWCLEHPRVRSASWAQSYAGGFFVAGFLYLLAVLAQFADALVARTGLESWPLMTVFWGVAGLLSLMYVVVRRQSDTALILAGVALLPALLVGLGALGARQWEEGVLHQAAVTVYVLLGILVCAIALLRERYRHTKTATTHALLVAGVGALLVYGVFAIARFWLGVFGEAEVLVSVATYTTYAVIAYGAVAAFMSARLPWGWVQGGLWLFALPLVLSIDSFFSSAWREGAAHPDAVGLYVLTTLLLLTAVGMRQRVAWYAAVAESVRVSVQTLLIVGGVYAAGLVWLVSGAVVPSAVMGIVLALFVYSVVGLVCYSYGRAYAHTELRYAGITLLVAVVARLLLVDVWTMATPWNIVTFLGIGLLFIVTALFERPFRSEQKSE